MKGVKWLGSEGEVRGDVSRLDAPLTAPRLEVVAVELSWMDVVLSISEVEFALLAIDGQAIG